ncbi:MAG: hypothetical protein NC489_33400, partial [Ruminococcus flavefaciens]|nr:hypothetical protein [Ruminococcus flavefaciens]
DDNGSDVDGTIKGSETEIQKKDVLLILWCGGSTACSVYFLIVNIRAFKNIEKKKVGRLHNKIDVYETRNHNRNIRMSGKYGDEYGNCHDRLSDYLYGDKFTVDGEPFMYSMKNKTGGSIVVSFVGIEKGYFDNTVKYFNSQGRKINIIL